MNYVEIEPCLMRVSELWYVLPSDLNEDYPNTGSAQRKITKGRQMFLALGFWDGTPWKEYRYEHIVIGLLETGEFIAFPLITLKEMQEEFSAKGLNFNPNG